MATTSFGEAVKNALNMEQKERSSVTSKKTNYQYEVEIDPSNGMDFIVTLFTTGKDKKGEPKKNILQKLFVLFSRQKMLLQIKDKFMTDEYTFDEGIQKFFSHLHRDEYIPVGSSVMKEIFPKFNYKAMFRAMVIEPKMMLSIKDGVFTVDTLREALYDNGWTDTRMDLKNEAFPWASEEHLDIRWGYDKEMDKQIECMQRIFTDYSSNSIKKQLLKEMKRIGFDTRDTEIIAMGDLLATYFDVPFAAKCMKEYSENNDLDGLTYNSLDELLGIKHGQNNYRMVGNTGAESYIYDNYTAGFHRMKDDVLADTEGEYFVRFKDKNTFFEYITKRSFEESFNKNLAHYIHMWMTCIKAEIYIYNDVLNLYPSQCKYLKTDDGEMRMLTRDKSMMSRRTTNMNKGGMIAMARSSGDMEAKLKRVGDILEGDYSYYGRTYFFKCLRTREDYAAESASQGNCVGSICLSKVLNGTNMAIFSLRKGDDREHSWITVDVDPFTGEFPTRVGRALKAGNADLNDDEERLINFLERECMKKIKESNKRPAKTEE